MGQPAAASGGKKNKRKKQTNKQTIENIIIIDISIGREIGDFGQTFVNFDQLCPMPV